jgi:DNA mismatch repair protein MutS
MNDTHVQALLSDTSRSLIEVYLDLQRYFETKYGPDALVMMEVGSFFEVYGVDNDTETIGKPKEVADILNLQLTRKNKSIPENNTKNPLMAGFPSVSFERYMERLVKEERYTIILIRQKGTPPKVERYLDSIVSPGIHVDYTLDHTEHVVASVIIDMSHGLYAVGYSAIDVTTGKTYLTEMHSTKDDPTFALDELYRLLQSHHTSELITTILTDDVSLEQISSYLTHDHIHMNTRRAPITYQNELFKRAYIIQSFLSPIECLDLERQPLTSESLAILLEFIIEHDHNVIEGLRAPVHIRAQEYMYLGNNPLLQLGITSTDPHEYTVLKHMDKTVTSMGARLFKNRIMNPVTSSAELESRYDLIDFIAPHATSVRRTLQSMYDLERISRRISLGKLHPCEINFLYDSLEQTVSLVQHLPESTHPVAKALREHIHDTERALVYLTRTFDTSRTAAYLQSAIEGSFFRPGVHAELDVLETELQTLESKLILIQQKYESLLGAETGKDATGYVEIKQLGKDGHHLSITKSRYYLIQGVIKETYLSIDGTVYALSDFEHKQQTTTVKITSPIIETISESIVLVQAKISALVKTLYTDTLSIIARDFGGVIDALAQHIASIDVAQSNAMTARDYVLSRPEIIPAADEDPAFLSLMDLRHPLVEAQEQRGLYVPNHIVLGNRAHMTAREAEALFADKQADTRGLLVYGINSSGKSSLMKSVGIAVLLAQAGCYVPASSMRFTLVRELFARIIAADNIEKGLSSFAVEMVELKHIFTRASHRSLILGDEISHGTETVSAISIVSATILRLLEVNALFLFTTHLHQLMDVPALKGITTMEPVHLKVHYDTAADVLVFDRTLQAGSGTSVYGLEFAQSLHMDKTFLRYAMNIRKELAGELSDIERLTRRHTSAYNKDVFLSSCAICTGSVDDTHHIQEQQNADAHGKIGHIDKDHTYNLLPICRTCHEAIHAGDIRVQGFVMTSAGLQLRFDKTEK